MPLLVPIFSTIKTNASCEFPNFATIHTISFHKFFFLQISSACFGFLIINDGILSKNSDKLSGSYSN